MIGHYNLFHLDLHTYTYILKTCLANLSENSSTQTENIFIDRTPQCVTIVR